MPYGVGVSVRRLGALEPASPLGLGALQLFETQNFRLEELEIGSFAELQG